MADFFPASPPARRGDLIIGIDGGGTTTSAVLANRGGEVLGRGIGGPSNIQAVGVPAGLRALDTAIVNAFATAGLPRSRVAAACLGLAGIDWDGGGDVIREWAERVGLADAVKVVNDAALLLAAGTPDGWGLAAVCGTGSIAFARTPDGRDGRCGGWGYLLGDEGSGYLLALSGLKAACRAHDRCGPPTVLLDLFLKKMNVPDAPAFIEPVYRGPWDRSAISGMAPIVLQAAADGDKVAAGIVRHEAREFAKTAAGAVRNLGLSPAGVPVALAGGVILESESYRAAFLAALGDQGITPGPVALVDDPVAGAVVLAGRMTVS